MKFYIDYLDWRKIITYATLANDGVFENQEIGGMAILEADSEGDTWIKEPTILKQEISVGLCELDKEALANYYTSMAVKHGTDIGFCWWHSHGKCVGEPTMSGVDIKTIKEDYSQNRYSVSLVVSTTGTHELRIDIFNPVHMTRCVDLNIVHEGLDTDALAKEVAEKCTKSAVVVKASKPGRIVRPGNVRLLPGVSEEDPLDDWIREGYDQYTGDRSYANWALFKGARNPGIAVKLAESIDEKIDLFIEGELVYSKLYNFVKLINQGKKAQKAGVSFKLPGYAEINYQAAYGGLSGGLMLERTGHRG